MLEKRVYGLTSVSSVRLTGKQARELYAQDVSAQTDAFVLRNSPANSADQSFPYIDGNIYNCTVFRAFLSTATQDFNAVLQHWTSQRLKDRQIPAANSKCCLPCTAHPKFFSTVLS